MRISAAGLVLGLHVVLVIGIQRAPRAIFGASGDSPSAPAVPVLLYRDEPIDVYAPDYPDVTVHLAVPKVGDIPLIPGVPQSAGATTVGPPTETRAILEKRLLATMASDPAIALPTAVPTDPERLQSTCRRDVARSTRQQGNQGHTLIRVFVTAGGHAAAARIDESSGDPSFDAFLVRCVKTSGEFAAPHHEGGGEWQRLLWVNGG
jgi:TonB family protein